MGDRVNVWFMLRRPSAAVRAALDAPGHDTTLLPIILGGMLMVSTYADILNMGVRYGTGVVMSVVLILGVLAGLVFALLAPALGLWMGNVLDRRHRAEFPSQLHLPPFPLKNLVWTRILGPEGIRAWFSKPVLRQWLLAWSAGVNGVKWLRLSLGGGAVGYGRLAGAVGKFSGVFVPAAVLVGILTFSLDAPGYGEGGGGSVWEWVSLGVKVASLGWFLVLWILLLQAAFALGWAKATIAGTLSSLGALGILAGALAWLTDIKWM